jgi:hypothetical protein
MESVMKQLTRLLARTESLDVVATAWYLDMRLGAEATLRLSILPEHWNGVVPGSALAIGFAGRGSHVVARPGAGGTCLEQAIAMCERPQDAEALRGLIEWSGTAADAGPNVGSHGVGPKDELDAALRAGRSGQQLVEQMSSLFWEIHVMGMLKLAEPQAKAAERFGDGTVALVHEPGPYVVERLHRRGARVVVSTSCEDYVSVLRAPEERCSLMDASALRRAIELSGDTFGNGQDMWVADPHELKWGPHHEVLPGRAPYVDPRKLAQAAVEALREHDAGK